jgi:hypothetical protein
VARHADGGGVWDSTRRAIMIGPGIMMRPGSTGSLTLRLTRPSSLPQ